MNNDKKQREKDDNFIFQKVLEFKELIGPNGEHRFEGEVPEQVLELIEEVREYNLNARPHDENTFQNDMRLIETKEMVRRSAADERRKRQ